MDINLQDYGHVAEDKIIFHSLIYLYVYGHSLSSTSSKDFSLLLLKIEEIIKQFVTL